MISSADVVVAGNGSYTAPNAQVPSSAGVYAWKVWYSNGAGSIDAAPVNETVNGGKADQTIDVTTHAPSGAVYGSQFTVVATGGGSANPIVYSSSGGCSHSGATFTMTSGTTACTVKYDQAGDSNYNAAPEVTETVTASKADQSINVTTHAPSSAMYGSQFTVAATAPGGAVSYSNAGGCADSGATFTMTSSTNSCAVKYDRAADSNYNAAPEVTETVTASMAGQSITVDTHAPGGAVFGTQFTVAAHTPGGPIAYTSAGDCTNSGATFTMISGTGSCLVMFDQAGNTNYNAAATVTETVNAVKAAQAITVTTHAPGSAVYGTQFTVAGHASSGGASPTGARARAPTSARRSR